MNAKVKTALDVSRKNWISISLGVLMIAAVVAIPTFIANQQEALQKTLEARKATFEALARLKTRVRHQPVVSLDPDAVAPTLAAFPNQATIDAGQASIKRVEEQSLQLKDMAVKMNVHYLLVPGSLPGPGDPFHFKQVYLQQFSKVIPAKLQSATPPTDDEIKAKADLETARITNEAATDKATGQVYNKDVLQQNIATMLARLPDDMRREAATQHKIYMPPNALSIQPEMIEQAVNTVPDIEKIWMAQVGLWIQQDVVDAIANLNSKSRKVADSTVKQLVQIYVAPEKESLYVLPTSGGSDAAPAAPPPPGTPAPSLIATNTDTDPFPRDFAVSPTGRVCNGVFDVVNFMVVMHVRAADVEKVIREFERDRLITVYQTDIQAVNSAIMQQQGFYFGNDGVVTLTMKCEELLMRDWTHLLMPPSVKTFLNVDQQPQQQTGAPQASAN